MPPPSTTCTPDAPLAGHAGPAPAARPAEPVFGAEFVLLVAAMSALVALSIDTMLPALGQIATDLGATHPNSRQWVLMALFGGLGVGQLFFGPLSDQIGRKPAIAVGLGVFLVGTLMCQFATSFEAMLIGRVVQGFGAAGPRVISVAMVRDRSAGPGMAQVMSLVMSVFILVPIVAPSLGQVALAVVNWRWIFGALAIIAVMVFAWVAWRQPETLPVAQRRPMHPRELAEAARRVLRHPVAWRYTVFNGVLHGGMMAYLGMAQQVVAEQYGVGSHFGLVFALLASGVGIASVLNARLVHRLGMQRLARRALGGYAVAALALVGACAVWAGHPPLAVVLAAMYGLFFSVGFLFGNGNALAMEPLGHHVGLAASVIGTVGTLIAMAVGTVIGNAYNGTLWPLALGYAAIAAGASWLRYGAERRRQRAVHPA